VSRPLHHPRPHVTLRLMIDPAVGLVAALAVCLLFAQSSLHKWRHVAEFRGVLAAYRIVPKPLILSFAILVLLGETAIAVLVLHPTTRPAALCAAATVLGLYALAILINLRRGRRDLDCGCTGPGERRPIAAWIVHRNFAIAALCVGASLPWSHRALAPLDAITILGGLWVTALLYVTSDRLFGSVIPAATRLKGKA